MMTFHTTLIQTEEIAENTYQYDFVKKDFSFTAGQYVIIDVDSPAHEDDRPNFRSLSIASAPHEEVLSFIVRHSDSAFKQSLHDAKIGDAVTIKGPLGHFVLPDDKSVPIVFLTAGVGITPVRSMIRHMIHANEKRNVTLCDSNRTVASAPCISELKDMDIQDYKYIGAITDDSEGWDGHSEMVTANFLRAQLGSVETSLYYVVGTKGFINGMKSCLSELAIPTEHIIVDNFG